MPGEPKNILCLIDTWQSQSSTLEKSVKADICNFLNTMPLKKWKVYFWASDFQPDYDVMNSLFSTNYTITNDSLEVFRPRPSSATYYFAGMHTNHCIFESEIGINKLLQINSSPEDHKLTNNFYIIEDLTCAQQPHGEPCQIKDLQYLHRGNCKMADDWIQIYNYRLQTIHSNTIWSKDIL